MKKKNAHAKKCIRYWRYLDRLSIRENRKAIHNGYLVPQSIIDHYNKGGWLP